MLFYLNVTQSAEIDLTHNLLSRTALDLEYRTSPQAVPNVPDFFWWLGCYPADIDILDGQLVITLQTSLDKSVLCRIQYGIEDNKEEAEIFCSKLCPYPIICTLSYAELFEKLETHSVLIFQCDVTFLNMSDISKSLLELPQINVEPIEIPQPNELPVYLVDTVELIVRDNRTGQTRMRPIDGQGVMVWRLLYAVEKKVLSTTVQLALQTTAINCNVVLTCVDAVKNTENSTFCAIYAADPHRERCVMTVNISTNKRTTIKCTATFSFMSLPLFRDLMLSVEPNFTEEHDGVQVEMSLPAYIVSSDAKYRFVSNECCGPNNSLCKIVCEPDMKIVDGVIRRYIVVSWDVSAVPVDAILTYSVPKANLFRQRMQIFIHARDPVPKPIFTIDCNDIAIFSPNESIYILCNFVFSFSKTNMASYKPLPLINPYSVSMRFQKNVDQIVNSLKISDWHGCTWWIELTPFTLFQSKSFYAHLHVDNSQEKALRADVTYEVQQSNSVLFEGQLSVPAHGKKYLFQLPSNVFNENYVTIKYDVAISEAVNYQVVSYPPENSEYEICSTQASETDISDDDSVEV